MLFQVSESLLIKIMFIRGEEFNLMEEKFYNINLSGA